MLMQHLSRALVFCLSTIGSSLAVWAASPIPSGKPANYPQWWFQRNVIVRLSSSNNAPSWPASYPVVDDYAVINQGQLKNFAQQAYNQMQYQLPASAWTTAKGIALTTLVNGWSTPSGDDYNVMNAGQLKNVAKPFYDVLVQEGFFTNNPWNGAPTGDDYAVVNVGQAKNYFSFALPLTSPVPVLDSGTYLTGPVVVLTPPTGISFYYTVDGSDPNTSSTRILATSGTIVNLLSLINFSGSYNSNLTSTIILKVIATRDQCTTSSIATTTTSITVNGDEMLYDQYNRRPKYLLAPVP